MPQAVSEIAVCPVVTFVMFAVIDDALTPLAAPAPAGRSVTFAYTRYVPPCFTKPCGLVPVVAAITVETDGAVLSTTTAKLAGEVGLLTTSVAVTV